MVQLPPWKHDVITSMAGVLQWMVVSSSEGTGEAGGMNLYSRDSFHCIGHEV